MKELMLLVLLLVGALAFAILCWRILSSAAKSTQATVQLTEAVRSQAASIERFLQVLEKHAVQNGTFHDAKIMTVTTVLSKKLEELEKNCETLAHMSAGRTPQVTPLHK